MRCLEVVIKIMRGRGRDHPGPQMWPEALKGVPITLLLEAKGNNMHYCTVKTRYNDCSRDSENSYIITINSLFALHIALISRVGTQKCVRYIY